ncbi:MAG: hypothetical protein IKY85_04290 [Bacteroidaceae bacterium]|nr:hypothetical protein [Bacteroidaceae bacterium]
MRTKKSSNSNMRFLFGSVFFFAMIIMSVLLFTYYAMREAWRKSPEREYVYTFSFSSDFAGRDYSVFFDDSLLYSGNPFNADTVIRVKRYVTEEPVNVTGIDTVIKVPHFTSSSSLFVVDGKTNIPTIINVCEYNDIRMKIRNGRIEADME